MVFNIENFSPCFTCETYSQEPGPCEIHISNESMIPWLKFPSLGVFPPVAFGYAPLVNLK